MPEQIVVTQDLGRKFGESWALRSMTFALEEGKLAVIVGPNGAGKTTTIRILTTNLRPSKGKAQILGMDVLTETRRIRKRIAYLPQGYEVNRNLTPYESIKWNLVARGISFSEAGCEARKWIAKMQLDHCRDRTCWTLSGGEKRRVAVAMILATNADLIFLDEPTTGLDVEGCYATWKMIREFLRTGTTILLTTHNMKEAETIADEVIFIKNGKSSIQDPLYKLLDKLPEKFRVTVKKNSLGKHSLKRTVDLGDKVVIYARDQEEVREILSKFTDLTSIVSVNQVGLEDAYLYLARAE